MVCSRIPPSLHFFQMEFRLETSPLFSLQKQEGRDSGLPRFVACLVGEQQAKSVVDALRDGRAVSFEDDQCKRLPTSLSSRKAQRPRIFIEKSRMSEGISRGSGNMNKGNKARSVLGRHRVIILYMETNSRLAFQVFWIVIGAVSGRFARSEDATLLSRVAHTPQFQYGYHISALNASQAVISCKNGVDQRDWTCVDMSVR
jgi:hypothetical protein